MAKAVVIYPIITIAFVALLRLQSPQPTSGKPGHRHFRLGRRLHGPNFDPLVNKMEHKGEIKGVIRKENDDNKDNNNPIEEVVEIVETEIEEEDEVYFGEDGKLNLTLRLTILFPMIDKSPKDGYISFKELEDWNIMQAYERMHFRTRDELDQNDRDYDGLVSFSEYLDHFTEEDIKKNNVEHGEAGWWMEKLKNVDYDQDGKLNFEELNEFLHPEDSKNETVRDWLIRDRIRRMDKNKDGKLNYEEFRDNVYDTFSTYYLFGTGYETTPSASSEFSKIDLNKDSYLTVEELKPIKHYLFPGELNYATLITNHLMKEVDENRDGKLSIDEVLNHKERFYHSIYIDEDEDEDEREYVHGHDEF